MCFVPSTCNESRLRRYEAKRTVFKNRANMLFLYCALFCTVVVKAEIKGVESEGEKCKKEDFKLEEAACKKETVKCPTKEIIDLPSLEPSWKDVDKVFFIECSDRPHLKPRQACAVESAGRNAGIPAIVVMTSPTLDLGRMDSKRNWGMLITNNSHNATCQLYHSSNIFFRYANNDELFKDSPMEKLHTSGLMATSEWKLVQYSDAMRLILIQKYGGFYADLDMNILKPLKGLNNFISGDHFTMNNPLRLTHIGSRLNNAIFHFDSGHKFIQTCLDLFAESYKPEVRESGGPDLLSNVYLNIMCKGDLPSNIGPKDYPPEKCSGINILPQNLFYPIGWWEFADLSNTNKSFPEWESLFDASYGVHLYNSSKGATKAKILKRRFYGQKVPVYLYLAVNTCPLSFESFKGIF